ncbi:tRNA synthetases class I (I, l, M and v) domain-containing protein [Sarocladium implicatum]|nr:tRNA synthetases class I (I, l, M and v) domain-containing protein [Sarocladium implicatum]
MQLLLCRRQLPSTGALRSLPTLLHAHRLQNASPRLSSVPKNAADSRRCYALELKSLDAKWRAKWAESRNGFQQLPQDTERPRYILPMFPYPSGSLHLGHLRVYTIADVVSRYHQLKGDSVVLPMGWDAFGLPAENAALQHSVAPDQWTRSNIQKMKDQLELMNGSWSWERELSTCDPEFYKHTQKLFLMLYERGLAYQADGEVNWDPVDKTVLANEQVDAEGRSWRSGALVEKRKLKQWYFRISEFREALLNDLDSLAKDGAWPENVLSQQKTWLGKSTGANIKFPIMATGHEMGATIQVFTTRPDTLFGVQYIALSATHPIVVKMAESDPELTAFLDTLPGLPQDAKIGYLLPNIRAVNPLAYHESTPDATKTSLPVYVASHVMGEYGEGAVMGVPGHDTRDHAFFTKHHSDQPVRYVLAASEDESTTAIKNEPFVDHGVMTEHSGPFKGRNSKEAGDMILRMLEQANLATAVEQWRLRDWLISRQRYWGAPIPIVHCDSCGTVPVPDEELPVELPRVDTHWKKGQAGNALASSPDFVNTSCPKCKGPAKRDTDTMDTFVDSSWYYTRFADPHNSQQLFSPEASKSLPVDIYLGGVEHAILHLLYARFIYKFLASTDLMPGLSEDQVKCAEPFKRLITQGMVHGRTLTDPDTGRFLKPEEVDSSDPAEPKLRASGKPVKIVFEKMSKSKHNGVDPTGIIAKYGADATRAHVLFQAPVADVLNWDEHKISGVTRWLHRLHEQVAQIGSGRSGEADIKSALASKVDKVSSMNAKELSQWDADAGLWREVQQTIKHVTASYEEVYSLNTVVSNLMGLTNAVAKHDQASLTVRREAVNSIVRMLAPIAPAFAEECWTVLEPSSKESIFTAARFPVTDGSEEMLQPRKQNCAVQVNGKVRAVVQIPAVPQSLEGDDLREWMTEQILRTTEGKDKFADGCLYDLSLARRVIPVKGGRNINYVL